MEEDNGEYSVNTYDLVYNDEISSFLFFFREVMMLLKRENIY